MCGAGLFATELPYGIKADWFNGMFWLTDSEGWGVVAPPVEMNIGDESALRVQRVNRYAVGKNLLVEVMLESGEPALVSLEHGVGGAIHASLIEADAFRRQTGSDIEALPWVSVDPQSCLYGRAWVGRIIVSLGLLSALALALRSRRRRLDQSG